MFRVTIAAVIFMIFASACDEQSTVEKPTEEETNSAVKMPSHKEMELACMKIGKTTERDHLKRMEILLEVGVPQKTVELTQGFIEVHFLFGGDASPKCVNEITRGIELGRTLE